MRQRENFVLRFRNAFHNAALIHPHFTSVRQGMLVGLAEQEMLVLYFPFMSDALSVVGSCT